MVSWGYSKNSFCCLKRILWPSLQCEAHILKLNMYLIKQIIGRGISYDRDSLDRRDWDHYVLHHSQL